jgi:hypothetical protein
MAVVVEADVGARGPDPGDEVDLVRGVDGVGRVVREGAVELRVEQLEVEAEAVEDGGHDEAPHAVGGVGDDLHRPQDREVHEGPHVGDVVGEEVHVGLPAPGTGRLEPGGRHGLDVAQPGVDPDGLGRREAHLDAVVGRRVVAGGEHGGRCLQVAGTEVGHVGGRQTEVDDVEALVEHPVGEGGGQLDARGPHVAGHEDAGGALGVGGEPGEGGADAPAPVGAELAGRQPPDVVGLEHGVEIGVEVAHGHRRP